MDWLVNIDLGLEQVDFSFLKNPYLISFLGYSVIILGTIKITLGLLFGNSLAVLFSKIPSSIIGVLLIVSGLQISLITVNLGEFASTSKRDDAYLCMIITAVSILGFANDGIGFLIGAGSAAILTFTSEADKNEPESSDPPKILLRD